MFEIKSTNSGVKCHFGDYGGNKISTDYQVVDEAEYANDKIVTT